MALAASPLLTERVVVQTASDTTQTFILFELAGAHYGVSSQAVHQLEMIEHITPVPNAPAFVDGVVFSRGQVIPALNLRIRFGFEKIAYDLRTRLIVVSIGDRLIGLIVDSAREFVTVPTESLRPPSEALVGMSGAYLKSVATLGERLILILDLDEVLAGYASNVARETV
jgi:purine-binding chemotaxis protein CheW